MSNSNFLFTTLSSSFFGGEQIFIVNRILSFSNYLQVFEKMLRIQNVMEKKKRRGNFIKI